MGLLDTVVDFLSGPPNWRSRMAPTLKMTSPEGTEIEAFWRGSPRSFSKKLGIFSYAGVKGNIVQDLEADSVHYSIPLFFEGENCDLLAIQFFAACGEKGTWEVIHPVHGFRELQLMDVSENDDLVESGNVIAFDSNWIEPIDPTTLQTAAELAGIVEGQLEGLNESALDQFINAVETGTAVATAAVGTATNAVQTAVDRALSPLTTVSSSISNITNATQRGIQGTLSAAVLDPLALGGQIQQLIQTPALAVRDVQARLSAYQDLAAELFNLTPDGTDTAARSTIAVQELALSAALGATGRSVASGTLNTRAQAVGAAEQAAAYFDDVTAALDASQLAYRDKLIVDQYFSQSESYNDAALLTAQAMLFALLASYDLKVEKRFIIDEPRAPIEITISEYGELGDNDELYDLFLESNSLKDNDILYLKAGTEVVVYV